MCGVAAKRRTSDLNLIALYDNIRQYEHLGKA